MVALVIICVFQYSKYSHYSYYDIIVLIKFIKLVNFLEIIKPEIFDGKKAGKWKSKMRMLNEKVISGIAYSNQSDRFQRLL